MKTFNKLFIAAFAAFTIGCSNTSQSSTEVETTMTVDSLLSVAPSITNSLITVEGVCTHTCKHGATKMFLIGTDDSKTIRVEACELGAFRPEVINSFVTVTGYLRETRIDEEYLAAWEGLIKENQTEGDGHGEAGAGCDTERAARGVESTTATDQIAEYRARIAEKSARGENPWISYYYIDATDYEIN